MSDIIAAIAVAEPTAGHRYVAARSLRAHVKGELDTREREIEYLESGDAGADNRRFAAFYRADLELWLRVGVMAQEEMLRWHEEAKQYDIFWGEGERGDD